MLKIFLEQQGHFFHRSAKDPERDSRPASPQPKISIVTVVKDDPEGLRRTAESLKTQNWRHFEWIIIDGGAKDSPSHDEAQLHFCNHRVVHETDHGIYDAMNKGIALAQGDLLHFLNAGDRYLHAQALSRVVEHHNDDVDFIYCHIKRSYHDGKSSIWLQQSPFNKGLFRNICHQAVFYHFRKHPQIQFDTSFKVAADFQWLMDWQRSSGPLKAIRIPEVLVEYNMDGFSQVHAQQALRERDRTFRHTIPDPMLKTLNRLNLLRQVIKLKCKKKSKAIKPSSPSQQDLA